MVGMYLDHLLTSNYPADDSDIPEIQLALLSAKHFLRSLDRELVEIEGHTYTDTQSVDAQSDYKTNLVVLRDKQRSCITMLQSTLSPLRRFPPEILSLIFDLAFSSRQRGVPMDSHSTIWRFSRVCRLWRSIICEGMQHTWSSIEIDCMRMHGRNLTTTLLELALQRSGKRSLSIKFYFSQKNKLGILTESEKECMALLVNQSFRWKELELQNIPITAFDSLSATVKSRMPLLQQLIIENIPVSLAADTPSTTEAFLVAPQLQHFTLSGFFRPSRFYLPWSQLESYGGSFRDFRDFLFVLQYAENLRACDVFLRNYHSGITVEHLKLQKLRIRGELVGLSRLELPSLQALILDELLIQDLPHVSTFLRRSPSVVTLEVGIPYDSGTWDSVNLFTDFIVSCKHITSLVLMGEFDMHTICSSLHISKPLDKIPVLIPHLQHLSLSVLPLTKVELANTLASMLESRQRIVMHGLDHEFHPLSVLTLYAVREPRAILERLKPLEEAFGLKVIVQSAASSLHPL
ncbi:hypothetical protein FB446DRAFT_44511 [Lentinula raphanica]|nr:hypothetical protein FB446DRAFT_44511 [Lentinula raphanica]